MKYIIANWKMNMDFNNIDTWIKGYKKMELKTSNKVVVAPSYIHIPVVKMSLDNNIEVAGQDVSTFDKGAHTGEISIEQLKDFCTFCILGHSELKEAKDITIIKVKKCLENNIIPILCIPNPLEEESVKMIKALPNEVLIVWEDPNNISTNGNYKEKPIEEIQEGFKNMKNVFLDKKLIYGGSVNEKNSVELAKIDELSGVLIGNASLKVENFFQIVKNFE